jgi:hypothetical protein
MRKSRWLAMSVVPSVILSTQLDSQTRPAVVQPAANAWMKLPTQQNQWDLVPKSVRTLRDEFWDHSGIAMPEPLTPENAAASGVEVEGPFSPDSPELPMFPERAIVTGTFKAFRSHLSSSGRSLYTEMIFQTHVVMEAPDGSDLAPETDITICFPGGTVTTQSGQTISYLTQPRWLFLQPSRSYLLVLSHHQQGNFYMLADDWDISDGTVRPNTRRNESRAKSSKSFLSGITTADAIRKINEHLSAKQ